VASLSGALRNMGVEKGDRVASYMPNIPETVVAFIACASIGAIWSSCSPDMGEHSVLDRFQQIKPKVLFAVDGYRYNAKDFDRFQTVRKLRKGLPSLKHIVFIAYLNTGRTLENSYNFNELTHDNASHTVEHVEFQHP